MDVEQALGAAAEERLPGGHQLVARDADAVVLHLAADGGGGGHAGSVGLAAVARLLALGGGAVTPQSWREQRSDESPRREEHDTGGGWGAAAASLWETREGAATEVFTRRQEFCRESEKRQSRDGPMTLDWPPENPREGSVLRQALLSPWR